MSVTQTNDNEQAQLWNGQAGQAWVQAQETLDRMLRPFEKPLLDAVVERGRTRMLDVGCGTGGTTVAAARALGSKGQCTGVDISEPMLVAARRRAEQADVKASFTLGDAQNHAFQPAAFDAVLSRFGVMFFDDPTAAFVNLRRAASKGADLRFIAWRSATENSFLTTAEQAAAPLLPNLPVRKPEGPGPFAFADAGMVKTLLKESGWTGVEFQRLDVACSLPAEKLDEYIGLLGPVGLALRDADEETRVRVIDTVRGAFAPYVHGEEVRFDAACWMVSAVAL